MKHSDARSMPAPSGGKQNLRMRLMTRGPTTLLLMSLVLLTTGAAAKAQSADADATVKCVPNIPSTGDVLVTGGEDLNENRSAASEFFHTATGEWLTACPTRVEHDEAQLLRLGNRLIEIGGERERTDINGNHIINRSTDIYVPATGKFKKGPSLKIGLEDFTAVTLANGTNMVIGGITNNAFEFPVQTAQVLASGRWKKLRQKMTIPRAAPCAAVMTGGSKSGQVLIAGGTNTSEDTPQLNSAELFNPATGAFTATSHNMIAARSYAVATALTDGTVLVTGGIDNNFDALNIAEIYHPDTDTFTQTVGDMNEARVDHCVALLPDGTVLVAGGEISFTFSESLDSAEIYDPATGKFTATALMNDFRDDCTATLISGSGTAQDGQVLIEGGFLFGLAENTAEIYDPINKTFTPTSNMNFAHGEANAAVIP